MREKIEYSLTSKYVSIINICSFFYIFVFNYTSLSYSAETLFAIIVQIKKSS